MEYTKSSRLAEQIRKVILTDYARLMATPQGTHGKFILIAAGIEFLGACLDKQHLNATARSEKRFNSAIIKLFPIKYHHFVKPGSVPYLYSDFRCPIIHQFKAGNSIILCSSGDIESADLRHLSLNEEGLLVLKAEEFYKDLAIAASEWVNKISGEVIL